MRIYVVLCELADSGTYQNWLEGAWISRQAAREVADELNAREAQNNATRRAGHSVARWTVHEVVLRNTVT